MKAIIVAVSAMMVLTACNKEAKKDADQAAAAAAAKTEAEASQAHNATHAGENAAGGVANGHHSETSARTNPDGSGNTPLMDSINAEARQTGRDVKEGVQATGSKINEEARQTGRDIGEALTPKGDNGTTEADSKLAARIRTALRADKTVTNEASSIYLVTDHGKVTLNGTVSSKEAKNEIARIARNLAGANMVKDEIKVNVRVGAGSGD